MPVRDRSLLLSGALLLTLSGCAGWGEKATGWLSTDAESFAVLGGRILSGKTNFPRDRQAYVTLQSVDGPALPAWARRMRAWRD